MASARSTARGRWLLKNIPEGHLASAALTRLSSIARIACSSRSCSRTRATASLIKAVANMVRLIGCDQRVLAQPGDLPPEAGHVLAHQRQRVLDAVAGLGRLADLGAEAADLALQPGDLGPDRLLARAEVAHLDAQLVQRGQDLGLEPLGHQEAPGPASTASPPAGRIASTSRPTKHCWWTATSMPSCAAARPSTHAPSRYASASPRSRVKPARSRSRIAVTACPSSVARLRGTRRRAPPKRSGW